MTFLSAVSSTQDGQLNFHLKDSRSVLGMDLVSNLVFFYLYVVDGRRYPPHKNDFSIDKLEWTALSNAFGVFWAPSH